MRSLMKAGLWLLGLAVAVFVVGMLFFKTRTAADDAMAPNIMAGDKYLLCYRCGIEKADAVLCDHPNPALKGVQIMGRVIGMEGDKVEVRDGVLRINDAPKEPNSDGKVFEYRGLHDPGVTHMFQLWTHPSLFGEVVNVLYAREKRNVPNTGAVLPTRPPQFVKSGHVFLMGDNRTLNLNWTVDGRPVPGGGCNSSFCYGQVPRDKCRGVVYFIYSAANRGGNATSSARRLSFVD